MSEWFTQGDSSLVSLLRFKLYRAGGGLPPLATKSCKVRGSGRREARTESTPR